MKTQTPENLKLMAAAAHCRADLRNLMRSILLAGDSPGLIKLAISEAESLCRFHTQQLTLALKDNPTRARRSHKPES